MGFFQAVKAKCGITFSLADREHLRISLIRPYGLLDINCSTLYYKPVSVNEETLLLMRL